MPSGWLYGDDYRRENAKERARRLRLERRKVERWETMKAAFAAARS